MQICGFWEYLSVHILVEKLQSPTSMPLNAKENKSKAFLVKTVTTILNWQPPETHCLNYCQYLVTVWKCSLTPLHCVLPSSLLHKLWHIHKLQISFVFKTWIYSWSLSFHSILCIQIQILRTYEKSYFCTDTWILTNHTMYSSTVMKQLKEQNCTFQYQQVTADVDNKRA